MVEFAATLYAVEKIAEMVVFLCIVGLIGLGGLGLLLDRLRKSN